MDKEMIREVPLGSPMREKECLSPQKRALERKALRRAEREEKRAEKKRLRLLRRTPCYRRHLRAAGALLMAGSLGITALVAALGRAFGWHSLLVSRFGDWAGDATVAFLALLLSLVLLYPLWLGMRAYAITLFHGEVGAEEGLFGFYTHTRLRRFAAMGALRLLGGVVILALAMAAVLLTGRGLSAHFLDLGNLGRAAVCSLLTPILALLLPLLWWWNEQADALALRFYLRDETLTVREARRASRFAMRHKGGLRMLLLLKKMPLAAIGLLFFGIGLALFSIPDLVWSLALFESRPT